MAVLNMYSCTEQVHGLMVHGRHLVSCRACIIQVYRLFDIRFNTRIESTNQHSTLYDTIDDTKVASGRRDDPIHCIADSSRVPSCITLTDLCMTPLLDRVVVVQIVHARCRRAW